jgi:death on curing protein
VTPEPVWLRQEWVLAFQEELIARFGGEAGLRDPGLLESALDRPRNKWAYGERGMPTLAAAYGFGIARNHPFLDGNKRAAFTAMFVFLDMNGFDLEADEAEATAVIEALAAGDLSEPALAAWVGTMARPRAAG